MAIDRPIAIIGIGCRFPGGVRSADDLWNLLRNGVDAITAVPDDRWRLAAKYHPDAAKPGRMNSRWGGFLEHIDRFDAQFFGIGPREAATADPQQRLLLEVAYEAVEDAGLTFASLAERRAAVYVGICGFDYGSIQLATNPCATIDAYTNLGATLSIAANRISYFFNLRGPSAAVDTACSSSLVAAHLACQSLWRGESELAFAAGVNLILRPEVSVGFSKASMLSPDGRCKTFDARANGYVRAEGSGVVILKPLARALEDGDRIYALVRATAVNQDGRTQGISVPNPAAQKANILDALGLAGVGADTIQYVEAHGTGTAVGDPIETAALGEIYGKARATDTRCVVGSVKTNLGHLESASGIAGLIKATLCLHHAQIPANLHFETPNPQIPFDDLRLRVAQRLEAWPETWGEPPRAGVNSFGFGGTNAHAILEAPPHRETAAGAGAETGDKRAWVLPISAASEPARAALARAYLQSLDDERGLKGAALADICSAAGLRRSHHDFRLALVADDREALKDQLDAFLRTEARPNSSSGRRLGESQRPVFVCSGMGQQWWAMGRELLAQEPVFRAAVEEVSSLYEQLAGASLLDELLAGEERSRVGRTDVGQPAIFGLQVGLAALWRSWGIEPAAVLGHSAGEMAAAHIAGALSLEDAVTVTFHRSRLQSRTAGQGAMLAAGISRAEAERVVEKHAGLISLAAVNAPRSVTFSGDAAVLAEIEDLLERNGFDGRALKVDVPFHSRKMEQLESELLLCLGGIRPRAATIPFFSTVTAAPLTGSELDAKYWYRNVREPVLFADTMAALIRSGHRLFVEIGAHPILRHDIASCLKEQGAEGATLGSLRRGEAERAALLGSLGRMYSAGCDIDWGRLFPPGARAVNLPRYVFQHEVHWRETDRARSARLGLVVHPLLGQRSDGPKPAWNVDLDVGDLGYLADHRLGSAIIFPAAGYVEMALAAAQEVLGNVPCVLEDLEFQRFLPLDKTAGCPAQVVFDPDLCEFSLRAVSDAAENKWDLYARGSLRAASRAPAADLDPAAVRGRCPEEIEQADCQRMFARMGLNYGPAFQGITRLWRGEREAIAEINAPAGVSVELGDYRLHPAILDACFQSALAVIPGASLSQRGKTRAHVPVRVDRIRFHASPPAKFFAIARAREFNAMGLTVDIDLVDAAGHSHVEVRGLVCRPTEQAKAALRGALYEYEWKLTPLGAAQRQREADHLPQDGELAAIVRRECDLLYQRFDRLRYQNEFRPMSDAAAAGYIMRGLSPMGWTQRSFADTPVEDLADRMGLAPQYRRWLRLMSRVLTPELLASAEHPERIWRSAWNKFPESQVELMLGKVCAENLPAILKGELDPLNLLFPNGGVTVADPLYRDSPTFRPSNLLAQKALAEIVRHLPKGRALRILEIGGGSGGMTSFLLPILPEHATEYVFTDISPRLVAHAHSQFQRYPFVQCRTLDIEGDSAEQGFDPHSFDIIVASDVLHATRDLRKTLERIKRLVASNGMLLLLEVTRPWLVTTLTFGLTKGWWLFEDEDVRPLEPTIPQEQWTSLLRDTGFGDVSAFADCPDKDVAQHALILARAPRLPASSDAVPPLAAEPKPWLIIADGPTADRRSAGEQLAAHLKARGHHVFTARLGAEFSQGGAATDSASDGSSSGTRDGGDFTIRAGKPNDMRRLFAAVGREAPRLAGIIHCGSLDIQASASMRNEDHIASARLGCIGVCHLLQALAVTDGFAVDSLWLVTRAAQQLDGRAGPLEVAQSPLWGLGRVAVPEYQHLRCRMVDLSTGSPEEIGALADEVEAAGSADEIALHGELRYVRSLQPLTPSSLLATDRRHAVPGEPFRIEVRQPGSLEALAARPIERCPPGAGEIEVEIAASGLNFKDLLTVMGLVPKDAMIDEAAATLIGLEGAGRVVAIGRDVTEFAVGDEVMVVAPRSLATHVTIDRRYAVRKPPHLSLEQAATIPVAFVTAFYSLHTLAGLRRGERVLIHAGAGGVGMAAVQLALQAGATVFATAGSPEKRQLVSALGAHHVMDSRSLAFADEILELTSGEGVDVVLNSLAGEAIDKSLSVLKPFGRFVEIGLMDVYNNRKIGMRALRRNISMFVVDLSPIFGKEPDIAQSLLRQTADRFGAGGLTSLPHRVCSAVRVADAFRAMAQARHVGKLVVSVKDADGLRLERGPRPGTIDRDGSYLITGGLGGFGLALADHFVRHGARHIVLAGRSGPSPSAQAFIDGLHGRGADVRICPCDVTRRDEVQRAIAAAQALAPLRGIIHGAMVLDDAPIERLSEERMWTAMAPKIVGAWNLHVLTAGVPLDFFVMLSSFSSIIGTPGQANYAAGNAFLDALAFARRASGLPALTVNWGNVGGVGYVSRNKEAADRLDRLGTTAMPISGALDVLDDIMASDKVQVGIAELDWNAIREVMGTNMPARLAGLCAEGASQGDATTSDARVREILAADAAALPPLLEVYIRDHLARAIGTSPARVDVHQPLLGLGLDSLSAVEVRNRITFDLGLNVPLAKIIQGVSVKALATYIAERLTERKRGDGEAAAPAAPGAESGMPASGAASSEVPERQAAAE